MSYQEIIDAYQKRQSVQDAFIGNPQKIEWGGQTLFRWDMEDFGFTITIENPDFKVIEVSSEVYSHEELDAAGIIIQQLSKICSLADKYDFKIQFGGSYRENFEEIPPGKENLFNDLWHSNLKQLGFDKKGKRNPQDN